MKVYFILIILAFTLLSCKTSEVNKTEVAIEQNTTDTISKLSPMTALLLDEYFKEKKQLTDSTEYVPSSNLIEKYSLKQKNNLYFVNALIKVDENFSEKLLTDDNYFIRTKAGNIYTMSLTIEQLIKLSENKNVKYIQIDEKIRIKK